MSKRTGPVPNLAIEYSGRGLAVYDPMARTTQAYPDLATAGAAYGGRSIVIGLSRRSVFLRTVRVPNAGPEEIRQVLMMRADDLFPIGAADLALDFRLTDDIDAEGRLAVVSAVPVSDLRRIRDEARAAGFKLLGVMPVAFGSASVARSIHQNNAAIVSRDQEGIGIDIVFNGEVRQSRLIAPTAAIEAEVCRTYSLAGIPCGAIVSAGGVVLKEPDFDTGESPLAALIEALSAGAGVDLRLPEELEAVRRRARNSRRNVSVVLALAAVVLVGIVFKQEQDRAAALEKYQSKSDAALAKLRATQKSMETAAAQAETNRKTLDLAFSPAQHLGDVVAIVSNRAMDSGGMWLSGISVERGKTVAVRGTAKTSDAVATFMQKLSKEPRFRDVHLTFANNGVLQQVVVQQFSLSAFPQGNLPLSDPTKAKKAPPVAIQ